MQGGVTGPLTLSFATPFEDNNYTLQVTVVGDEVAPGTPTIAANPAVGLNYVTLQPAGAGCIVYVANNDSIQHSGVVMCTGIHD